MRPTVVDWWRAVGGFPPPGKDRIAYWEAMARVAAVWPWPRDWTDRAAGWLAGVIFRVDRPGASVPWAADLLAQWPKGGPSPDDLALLVPDRTGRLWAYSHRAVFMAARSWEYWQLGRVFDRRNRMRWLNGFPGTPGRLVAASVPSPVSGFDAVSAGGRVVLFHPRLLGPVAVFDPDQTTLAPSPGVVLEFAGDHFRARGEIVPDGLWHNMRVEPIVALNGWFDLT